MSDGFRQRAILAVLAGGFLLLALEVLHLHRIVVLKTAVGWLPVFYCFAACCCSVALVAGLQRAHEVSTAVFATGIVLGVVGTLFHVRGDLSQLTVLVGLQPRPTPIEAGVTRPEDDTRATSAVAPLSISGLSGVGLLLAWPRRQQRPEPRGGQGVRV